MMTPNERYHERRAKQPKYCEANREVAKPAFSFKLSTNPNLNLGSAPVYRALSRHHPREVANWKLSFALSLVCN
jgi:hypothetical protein